MNPLISVLIPAYNRADTIERCIHSAQASSYQQLQIIVADNGSTDGTLAIVNRIAAGDQRVEVIAHPRNLGPIPNWRSCLDAARGDFVHWLWSDDWIEPGFYPTLISRMHARQAEIGFSGVRVICPAENWFFIKHSLPDRGTTPREMLRLGLGGRHLPVSPAACLLSRRSCLKHFHADIPRIGHLHCSGRGIGCDALMILGALHDATAVACVPEPLVNFNVHSASISVASGERSLASHYAWARLWWSRRLGYPRAWGAIDYLRLLRDRCFIAFMRSLL